MKLSILTVIFISVFNFAFSQQQDFEGTITYHVVVTSKSDLMSNKVVSALLELGNTKVVEFKHGNYKQVSGNIETYYITKDQKEYTKFEGIDTLYYRDYSDDTTKVSNMSLSTDVTKIAGYDCKSIAMQNGLIHVNYYYAPALYMNPEYDKNNRIGRFDVYTQKTSAVYLRFEGATDAFSVSLNAVKVQSHPVGDDVFQLPALPVKKFVYDELVTAPEFTRPGGWTKFLQNSINPDVASRYLKIPKGLKSASQQVLVNFMINEFGFVAKAEVANKKDVNSKLAEEALRVVNASPAWRPAKFHGDNIIQWMKVPITFEVTAK